jgi:hypothetical protein
LELEIAGRYYYQAGKLRQGLVGDPTVEQAINTLNDQNKYKSILGIAP